MKTKKEIRVEKINLGSRVKDKVTGIEGIVTGRVEYLYGCEQCVVTPTKPDANGRPLENQWFDQSRLTLIKDCEIKRESVSDPEHPGGMPAPPSRERGPFA